MMAVKRKVFDIFADGVAVYTSSQDPSLECLTAERKEYKPNKKVVYTWNLHGNPGSENETYVVEYYPGPSNDTVFAIVNHDKKHPTLVKLDYSNNKNCVVANFPYKGEGEHLDSQHRSLSPLKAKNLKVADYFPDAVAVYASSDDPSLECLYANRTEYVPRQKAVYVWSLKGHRGSQKGTYKIEFRPGPSPDMALALTNDVCMLWVTGSSRFSVPQECVDHFEDICDAEVPVYNEDICKEEL
ncbi:hypothetical protein HPB51_006835 [Rhipicephalus microplus]|uniref:Lipocalin n=1 Tax=Rhipicephalus microplus TaxID=6941 RepID=A0A9J6E746_RHIMP|nr:hypothetical protein HPB51_006835 [Rhipicephalus microplus]